MVKHNHLTDKAKEDLKLVDLALTNNDARAYSTLVSKYRDPVYYMLLERLNNSDLDQELTIEAFGKAFSKLHQYSEKYAFSTWLFAIARNNSIDYLRKNRASIKSIEDFKKNTSNIDIPELQSDHSSPETILISKQKLLIINELIDKLKPKQKELIKMRYLKEYSIQEIAEIKALKANTVKVQIYRARVALFKLFSKNKNHF